MAPNNNRCMRQLPAPACNSRTMGCRAKGDARCRGPGAEAMVVGSKTLSMELHRTKHPSTAQQPQLPGTDSQAGPLLHAQFQLGHLKRCAKGVWEAHIFQDNSLAADLLWAESRESVRVGGESRVASLPVCVRMWPCSNQGREKALPHILQTQGSVWLRMCILRAPRLTYSFSQYLQLKDFLV